jgi:hypothetical protein
MGLYSDYNIIPVGDHCAIPIILKELNLRKKSYPFDWVTHTDQAYDTNIMYNIELIKELYSSDNIDDIVRKYIGNIHTNNEVNSMNNIWFAHDKESIPEIVEKYKRRFIRLKEDLNKKNIFVLLTRIYYIEKDIFQQIVDDLLKYNSNSIILFISGTNHTYFESTSYTNVIFKYIQYDSSNIYNYDYTGFRPNIKKFLSELLDAGSSSV